MGFRAIPNGYAFDREGMLIGERVTGFDIRRDETRELVRSWLARRRGERVVPSAEGGDAMALFARGTAALHAGRREEALALWHRAYAADPANLVIRKQIWRALYPERFGDPIDTAWQREQTKREDGLGFAAANPTLPAAATG